MNQADEMLVRLEQAFPEAIVTIDEPDNPDGDHFIDVKLKGKLHTFEWSNKRGFGFWNPIPEPVYGQEPAFFIKDPDAAFEKMKLYVEASDSLTPERFEILQIGIGWIAGEKVARDADMKGTVEISIEDDVLNFREKGPPPWTLSFTPQFWRMKVPN
ncbi:MAG: hypothetical protein ABA06_01940 [Parcubacteria bacterium C7867-001]|nr:MAG: hypothetical protein ABA06_01940 [Parcubacteria bacterium C7867-001]